MAPPSIDAALLMPRFSIVIPTRERPDTLRCALATCLNQDFDDYEIVVCDNGTTDRTREVVGEIASGRVRHIRAPRSLAMSDNWELGVSEARGEFVLVLGDDDGLMPFALAELDRLLDRLRTPVVRWEASFYSMARHQHGGRGKLPPTSAPADTEDAGREIDDRGGASVRGAVCAAADAYSAVVHRSLIDRMRSAAGVCSRIGTLTCSPVSPSAIWPDNIRRSASRCTLRGRRAAVLASRTSSTVVDPPSTKTSGD